MLSLLFVSNTRFVKKLGVLLRRYAVHDDGSDETFASVAP